MTPEAPARKGTALDLSVAWNGGDFINNASSAVANKKYGGFLVINDTVLAGITMSDSFTGVSKLVGVTLPAGLFVPGYITAIQVTSGLILGVNA